MHTNTHANISTQPETIHAWCLVHVHHLKWIRRETSEGSSTFRSANQRRACANKLFLLSTACLSALSRDITKLTADYAASSWPSEPENDTCIARIVGVGKNKSMICIQRFSACALYLIALESTYDGLFCAQKVGGDILYQAHDNKVRCWTIRSVLSCSCLLYS